MTDYANYIASLKYQNTPEYAWQQQLVSGANLAKNLSPQTLLGLALGTGLGNWLGHKFGNWQRSRDDNLQYGTNPEVNPTAVNTAVANALFPRDGFDLGWKLQHQFQTPQQFLNERLGSNPSSWDWRQKLIPPNTQYFPMTQTTATPTPTIPTPAIPKVPTTPPIPQKFSPPNSLTGNWGTAPFNGG